MVVYRVLAYREKVDYDLIALRVGNGKNFRYISFKESSPKNHIYTLYINEINNVETRFESLLNMKVFDHVKYKGEIESLRGIMISIKVNNTPLFVEIEQRSGSNEDNVLVLTAFSLRREAQR